MTQDKLNVRTSCIQHRSSTKREKAIPRVEEEASSGGNSIPESKFPRVSSNLCKRGTHPKRGCVVTACYDALRHVKKHPPKCAPLSTTTVGSPRHLYNVYHPTHITKVSGFGLEQFRSRNFFLSTKSITREFLREVVVNLVHLTRR